MHNTSPTQTALPIDAPAVERSTGRPKRPMPGWLRRRLEETGEWDPTGTGVTRAARVRTCTKCGATILEGLDDDVAAFHAIADPTPCDPADEAFAILTGRRTYRLRTFISSARLELDARGRIERDSSPAGGRDRNGRQIDVVPEHRCGQPLDTHGPPIPARRTTHTPDDGTVPF